MKKITFSFILLFVCLFTYAQDYPTGQVVVKDMKTHPLYKDIQRARISIPSMGRSAKTGIKYIDNSKLKYFPPIISQVGGSCAYASGIGYIYNYEYNVANNLDSSKPENIYNYLNVYAYLNDGSDTGGHASQGWNFVKENGLPSILDNKTYSIYEWCAGYDAYYNGMQRSADSYKIIYSDRDGAIDEMKQYLIDHGNGSPHGGLIQFSAWAHPLDPDLYNGPSESGYEAIIHHFGNDGMHSMTIVGFDDTVEYDYNKNGKIEEEERGAFICANSWGERWGEYSGVKSEGKFYAPYYTFTTLKQSRKYESYNDSNMGGGTGNGGKGCMIMTPLKVKKDLVLRINLKHTSRNDIRFELGVANDRNATAPEKVIKTKFMRNQGGDRYMKGKFNASDVSMEFGLNISQLTQYITSENPKFFFKVINNKIGQAGKGEILSCSLLDYRKNKENPIVYLSNINSSKLEGSISRTATIETGMPQLEDGINTSIKLSIDSYNKDVYIYLNSHNKTLARIDVMNADGSIRNPLMIKEIQAGKITETINLGKISKGTYAIRAIIANRFVYKKFIIK